MAGIPSKARLIADRARLERAILAYERAKPSDLTEAERSALIESISQRVKRLDEEIRTARV